MCQNGSPRSPKAPPHPTLKIPCTCSSPPFCLAELSDRLITSCSKRTRSVKVLHVHIERSQKLTFRITLSSSSRVVFCLVLSGRIQPGSPPVAKSLSECLGNVCSPFSIQKLRSALNISSFSVGRRTRS